MGLSPQNYVYFYQALVNPLEVNVEIFSDIPLCNFCFMPFKTQAPTNWKSPTWKMLPFCLHLLMHFQFFTFQQGNAPVHLAREMVELFSRNIHDFIAIVLE